LGHETLSNEERDEVRNIAQRVAQMQDDDQGHRDKLNDDLDIIQEMERRLDEYEQSQINDKDPTDFRK